MNKAMPPKALHRFLWWASTPNGLSWLFGAGLLLRLILILQPGFDIDMGTFRAWSMRLSNEGLGAFYPSNFNDYFVDYPPGWLYVLWILGKIAAQFGTVPSDFLLKLPVVVADMLLAFVVVKAAEVVTPAGFRKVPWRGMAAAAILFNPALLLVGPVWGQVDAVPALLLIAGALFVAKDTLKDELAGLALLVLAIAVKPQALFAIPVIVALLVHRHILSGYKDEGRAGAGAGAIRTFGLGVFSLAVGIALFLPFRMGPVRAFEFFKHASGTYEYTSVWAFNLWGAAGFWEPDTGAGAQRILGLTPSLLGLMVGAALVTFVVVLAVAALRRGEDALRVTLYGSVATVAGLFAVVTRIHERYLFLAVACLTPFVAYRAMRWALGGLSALYFLNAYFAFAYYEHFYGENADASDGLRTVFNLLYGDPGAINTPQRVLWSILASALCIALAILGWRWLSQRGGEEQAMGMPEPERPPVPLDTPLPEGFSFHPVGARGAAVGLLVLVIALATRLPGLASPPGMYFDEVYHARTAGEYLQNREVYEWTHPPLAKEIMAATTRAAGGYTVTSLKGADTADSVAGDGTRVALAEGRKVRVGAVRSCVFDEDTTFTASAPLDALAVTSNGVWAAVTGPLGSSVEFHPERARLWSAPLPAPAKQIVVADTHAFVVTADSSLTIVDFDGEPTGVGDGFSSVTLTQSKEPTEVWAGKPASNSAARITTSGSETKVLTVGTNASSVLAPDDSGRLLAGSASRDRLRSIDLETGADADRSDLGVGPDLLITVPRTGLAWAFAGSSVHIVEPRGMAILSTVRLSGFPSAAAPAGDGEQVLASVPGVGVDCVSSKVTFGWRIGSAVTGALMILLVFLLMLRLFGSYPAALFAALLLAVCGLAFTMARIAMNDSYVTAAILGSWFAATSSLYRWGANSDGSRPSRAAALSWLVAAGVFAGLAVSSKWVGLFGLGGVGLMFVIDAIRRGRRGAAGIAGHPVASVIFGLVALIAIPAGIYLLSYLPYLKLGHNLGELVKLQSDMYGYHANLTADHPYGSPWWHWLIGNKAVYMHLYDPAGPKLEQLWGAPNPVVFLVGLGSMVGLATAAISRRSMALAVPLLAALAQFVPWIGVTRVTFLYHYLPVVPWLAIAIAWFFVVRRRSRWAIVIAIAAIAVFVIQLPVLDASLVTESRLEIARWARWMYQ